MLPKIHFCSFSKTFRIFMNKFLQTTRTSLFSCCILTKKKTSRNFLFDKCWYSLQRLGGRHLVVHVTSIPHRNNFVSVKSQFRSENEPRMGEVYFFRKISIHFLLFNDPTIQPSSLWMVYWQKLLSQFDFISKGIQIFVRIWRRVAVEKCSWARWWTEIIRQVITYTTTDYRSRDVLCWKQVPPNFSIIEFNLSPIVLSSS